MEFFKDLRFVFSKQDNSWNKKTTYQTSLADYMKNKKSQL